jgi:hypothetical protein
MTPIRNIALSSFNSSNQRRAHPTDGKHNSPRRRLADSVKSSSPLQSRNKRAGPSADGGEVVLRSDCGLVPSETTLSPSCSSAAAGPSGSLPEHDNHGYSVMAERKAEEVGNGRDERVLDTKKLLTLFRVDQKKLA